MSTSKVLAYFSFTDHSLVALANPSCARVIRCSRGRGGRAGDGGESTPETAGRARPGTAEREHARVGGESAPYVCYRLQASLKIHKTHKTFMSSNFCAHVSFVSFDLLLSSYVR
jgi:hypothetical protein